jgi:uncharacterized protein (TIGR00288 family)
METKPRIALLIDADNASADRIELILNELAGLGETNVRRAYGNWAKPGLKSWAAVLHQQAIRPMQQYDYSSGKNASDMAMVIDAMALLYTDRPDAFAIVSSDADFTPLVMHLREKGAAVYGFGEQKTPEPFKTACSRFVVLSRPPKSPPKQRQPQDAVDVLTTAVRAKADKNGWARVQAVRQVVGNKSTFDPRTYGSATLSKLLVATGLFEIRNEGTPSAAVRDKRQAVSGQG